MTPTNPTRSGLIQILCSVMIWGTMPFVVQYTSREMSAGEMTAVRLLIAGILMVSWVGPGRFYRAVRSNLGLFLILGIFGLTLPQLFYIYALRSLPIPVLTFITNSYPALAIFLAVILLKEKPTSRHLIGIASALVGLYLLAGPAVRLGGQAAVGVALAGLASLGWATSAIAGKKITARLNSTEIVAGRHVLAGIFAIPLMLLEGGPVRGASLGAWMGTILLAVMSVASFYSYYKGLARVSVSTASVIESFTPVVTLILSAIFFGEILDGARMIGAGCVLLGTVLVSTGPRPEPDPAPTPVGD